MNSGGLRVGFEGYVLRGKGIRCSWMGLKGAVLARAVERKRVLSL